MKMRGCQALFAHTFGWQEAILYIESLPVTTQVCLESGKLTQSIAL